MQLITEPTHSPLYSKTANTKSPYSSVNNVLPNTQNYTRPIPHSLANKRKANRKKNNPRVGDHPLSQSPLGSSPNNMPRHLGLPERHSDHTNIHFLYLNMHREKIVAERV